MGFDRSRLFAAFARAGLLDTAVVHLAGGDVPVDVGYRAPTRGQFGSALDVEDYQIEFEAAAVNILRGTELTVRGKRFKVQRLTSSGDGFYSLAILEPV